MSENDHPKNAADQSKGDEPTVRRSRPRTPHGAVVRTLIPFSEEEVPIIRRLFPDAEERLEIVRQEVTSDNTWVDVVLPVFRCRYRTMDEAHKTRPELPTRVRTHLEATIVLDDEEFDELAVYHAREFMRYDYMIPEVSYSSPELHDRAYHRQRLQALGAILGKKYVRSIINQRTRIHGGERMGLKDLRLPLFEHTLGYY